MSGEINPINTNPVQYTDQTNEAGNPNHIIIPKQQVKDSDARNADGDTLKLTTPKRPIDTRPPVQKILDVGKSLLGGKPAKPDEKISESGYHPAPDDKKPIDSEHFFVRPKE